MLDEAWRQRCPGYVKIAHILVPSKPEIWPFRARPRERVELMCPERQVDQERSPPIVIAFLEHNFLKSAIFQNAVKKSNQRGLPKPADFHVMICDCPSQHRYPHLRTRLDPKAYRVPIRPTGKRLSRSED